MNNDNPRVGCIGAGVLGSAIMRRLIDRGFAPLLVESRPQQARTAPQSRRDGGPKPCRAHPGKHIRHHVPERRRGDRAGRIRRRRAWRRRAPPTRFSSICPLARPRIPRTWLHALPRSAAWPGSTRQYPVVRQRRSRGGWQSAIGGREDVFERARPIWDALAGRATLMGSERSGTSHQDDQPGAGRDRTGRAGGSVCVRGTRRHRRGENSAGAVRRTGRLRSSFRRCSRRW